jgi:hypothetical protein
MSKLAVVKVYSVFQNLPAVIVVENGYLLREYLKGTVGVRNPVDEACPLKGIFFGKDYEEVFEKFEMECPEEWSSYEGCWVLVADFDKNGKAEEDMERIMKVLTSYEGDGRIVRVEGGGRKLQIMTFENYKLCINANLIKTI